MGITAPEAYKESVAVVVLGNCGYSGSGFRIPVRKPETVPAIDSVGSS